MSEIPSTSDTSDPFEVKDAGGGKGLGCFATKDIKPGDIVLVDYTPIHGLEPDDWEARVNDVVAIYETLDEREKQAWDSLHVYYRPAIAEVYIQKLAKQKADGSFYTEQEQQHYLNLTLAFNSNCFGGPDGDSLFLGAARFNHSCDPNLSYECSNEANRWVARACRHIVAGEELFITYIPTHEDTKSRQRSTLKQWGFTCGCDKCTAGVDRYTASLIQARDAANAFEPEKTAEPPIYPDDVEGMAGQLKLRIDCLKAIVGAQDGDDEDASRQKELTFALADASIFHQNYYNYWSDVKDDDEARDEARLHLELDREYSREASRWAHIAWPATHEVVRMLNRERRRAHRIWLGYLYQVFKDSREHDDDMSDGEHDDMSDGEDDDVGEGEDDNMTG
ncbi:hypothetical protein ANO14919_011800 [Xylariales sp. No.14919]|nr:hypothetical protein F5X98DRAFT_377353 [Xylaria grammica]GAW11828.1 hypothetical protein ANO14919_011800 [Xylariales sp. No.14919]